MDNQGFIRSSELTGSQKVAILLAEIGPFRNERYKDLFKALKLSNSEMKKIRLAMESLQPYLKTEPKDIREIYREQNVLKALLDFCEARGMFKPNKHFETEKSSEEKSKNDKTSFGKIISDNPEAVARIIGNWLDK